MGRNGAFKTSLDYYKSFYYVAKFKSISLAAKQLDLTQPTMSNSIKKLEEDLGCKLFERTRSGVVLTHEGSLLWEKVEPACDLIMEGESAVESSSTHGGGVLNIVAYEQGYLIYVMPALKKFLRDYPDVKVNLLAKPQDKMINLVRIGLADLTILFSPFSPEDGFKYTYIGKLKEKLAAGKEFQELKGRKVRLEELSDYPFIAYSAGTSKSYFQRWFEKKGIIYRPQMEVTGVSLMRSAIMDNYGIGDIYPPLSDLAEKAGQLFFIDLEEELPERRVFAVTKNEMSTITRIFLDEYMCKSSISETEQEYLN